MSTGDLCAVDTLLRGVARREPLPTHAVPSKVLSTPRASVHDNTADAC